MKTLYFYGTSLALHLLLLLLALLTWHQASRNTPVLGDNVPLVQAYVYEMPAPAPVPQTVKHEKVADVAIKRVVQPQKKVAQHARREIDTHARGMPTSELLARLHAAIQRQQHYPESAIAMEREGRTTVAFTLQVNGQIGDLRVLKSSGTASLDEAALAAVKEAAPFQGINDYLQEAREFNIDVVFDLA